MKFIDLFSGIGGFRMGMELAGHTPVGWIEKDKFARKSYEVIYNAEEEWSVTDIRDVKPEELPEADCYTGGFPCQSFSIAGNRGGFEDTRGTLFFEILRLAKERQPKYLFLENVRGLLNHDGGTTFSTILKSLDELGYSVEWQVLNSKNFGVPQNRERVFIIGHFGGFGGGQIFPIRRKDGEFKGGDGGGNREVKQLGNIVDDKEINFKNPQRGRVYSSDGVSPSLNCMEGGGLEPKIKVKPCLTPERGEKRQNGRRFKTNGEPSFTLNTQDRHGVVLEDSELKIRKLTPKECWRLQGFPDWAFEKAEEVNSDSQLYKQAGNAVTVNVVYEIAKKLKGNK